MSAGNPLKAYHVQNDDEGLIVFAKHGVVARRIGANELNTDFDGVEYCRRAPWADQYADQGWVPTEVLISKGWWQSCSAFCGSTVKADSKDGEGASHEPVFDGRDVYCNQACKNRADSKQGGDV